MLQASQLSFNTGDCSLLYRIFEEAVISINDYYDKGKYLKILTSDDMEIQPQTLNYTVSDDTINIKKCDSFYKEKIKDNIQKSSSVNNPKNNNPSLKKMLF